jgi:hypothetical protein
MNIRGDDSMVLIRDYLLTPMSNRGSDRPVDGHKNWGSDLGL